MNGVERDLGGQFGDAVAVLLAAPVAIASSLYSHLDCGCCRIPTPCWLPKPAGTCDISLSPECKSTIRLHISNCGWTPQRMAVTASGAIAELVSINPTTAIIDAQEERTVSLLFQLPVRAKSVIPASGTILVHGCRTHALHVNLGSPTARSVRCDVRIQDCWDNIHHWYDHFYCARPCQQDFREPGKYQAAVAPYEDG